MTTIKKCATTEECDNRYLLQKAFWLMVAMAALGLVGGSFAGGMWKSSIETRLTKVETGQHEVTIANDKLDLILRKLNK
jgi:hypothetical protein